MYNISASIKHIDVDFDVQVDKSYFNQNAFNYINTNGLALNEISLLHYSSIHYQSKFYNSPARRFRYTLDTIEPSLVNPSSGQFIFTGNEGPELQKITTEVIGVGFTLSLMHRLLDVKLHNFNKIPITGRGKRCDFEVIKNGVRFIVESKGRDKGYNDANSKILAQKLAYHNVVKYGVISKIPRDGTAASLWAIDPEIKYRPADRNYINIAILNHYSKVSRLAGFNRLAESINYRLSRILRINNAAFEFNNQPLVFENDLNTQHSIKFQVLDTTFSSIFAPGNDFGVKIPVNDKKLLVFGIEKGVMGLLMKQNYDELLQYSFQNYFGKHYSILDNGTFMTLTNRDDIE